jgi:outer membrane protein assembly factor BamB
MSSRSSLLSFAVFAWALSACATRTEPPWPFPAGTTAPLKGTWLTYQSNPAHNAVLSPVKINGNWTYEDDSQINSGLAVVGNTVFFDDFAGRVVALDARTGNPRWQWKTDNVLMSTPIVFENRIYVGSGRNGPMDRAQRSFAYISGTRAAQDEFWGRADGDHVFSLDATKGTLIWSYRTMGEDMPSPTIVGNVLVFANGDAHAYGIDRLSGRALWRERLGGISTMASATADGDSVLVSDCNFSEESAHTTELNASNGRPQWTISEGNCDSSPTLGAGLVYLAGIDGNRQSFGFGGHVVVVAVDAVTGRLRWKFRSSAVGPYTAVGSNERAIAGTYADRIYFQSLPAIDEVAAFDAPSGAIKWLFHTSAPVKMSVVVSSGRVYFGDVAGLFYTLDERSGNLLRTRIFNQPFSTSPPVVAGSVIFVVNGTTVNAFHT